MKKIICPCCLTKHVHETEKQTQTGDVDGIHYRYSITVSRCPNTNQVFETDDQRDRNNATQKNAERALLHI